MDGSSGVADLHVHTTASDGTCSVDDRASQARDIGLEAVAITDHDTVADSLDDRRSLHGTLELVTGVEVRADALDTKVELLGYYLDPTDPDLDDLLERVRSYRRDRNRQIVDRLQAEANGILGRPHIADVLIHEGIVDSVGTAFDQYLGSDGAAFVPMERVSAAEVFEAIQSAGGVVSLAHPGRIRADDVAPIVEHLVANGLDAIEVPYPYDAAPADGYADIDPTDAAAFAEQYGLLHTGGSDCHGPGSGKYRLGEVRITRQELDAVRDRAADRRSL
jgi:predicted metal-dependent phosphoesterase TrpH